MNILEIAQLHNIPLAQQYIWFPLVFVGFGVLGALFPFHTLVANFVSNRPTQSETRTYEDFYKFLGTRPTKLPCFFK